MKTREDILAVLAKQKPDLQRAFPVRRLAVFGSYARGDQRPDSDVDVLVDVDPAIGLRFVSLAETIEAAVGEHVDLVSRGAISSRHWTVIEPELVDV